MPIHGVPFIAYKKCPTLLGKLWQLYRVIRGKDYTGKMQRGILCRNKRTLRQSTVLWANSLRRPSEERKLCISMVRPSNAYGSICSHKLIGSAMELYLIQYQEIFWRLSGAASKEYRSDSRLMITPHLGREQRIGKSQDVRCPQIKYHEIIRLRYIRMGSFQD